MKQTIALLMIILVFASSCARQETPDAQQWISSMPWTLLDITTVEERITWSNAMAELHAAIVTQEAKVTSIMDSAGTKTNSDYFAVALDKQEIILDELRNIEKRERARYAKCKLRDTSKANQRQIRVRQASSARQIRVRH